MTTSILPLINSCKSLNLFLIELILRYANIGFAGFSTQRFFNPWEKSWDGCFWYHSLSFVDKCFSGHLEILKYYVKVIARLFHLDETDYCLGKIYKYCWSQHKSYPYQIIALQSSIDIFNFFTIIFVCPLDNTRKTKLDISSTVYHLNGAYYFPNFITSGFFRVTGLA